ncbi:hypothetical protein ALP65_03871 [Pseudomonas aeruginosa]|uniref:NADH:flavin oxidoreductase n=9 Tax=Gammaproteobacteria TaxID=1236 RepID=A0A3M5D7K7_PSEAI|nr:hypothetical protein ALP65_03871 [Pseudomonas aeruginosa]
MATLFDPIVLGDLELPNRIVMAPLTRCRADEGRVPNALMAEYYAQRADAGLILSEATAVTPMGVGYPDTPGIWSDDQVRGWSNVTKAVHAAGGRIFAQLWHVGSVRRLGVEPDASVPGYGPMEKAKDGKVLVHGMSKADIQDVIAAFAQAARDAQAIGMDGVEIHGAHGYLIDQFFWEGSNQRDDEYGGSLANRSRFAVELVRAVRAAVGADFPIIFRFSQWKQQDYSARLVETPEGLCEFLAPLVEAGVDIFHCSTRRFWIPEFEGSELNLAGWTRELTGKPTITVGNVGLDGSEFLQFFGKTDEVAQPASIDGLVERLDKGDLAKLFEAAAESGLPIMVFVGNAHCIQIHTGPVCNLKWLDDWFNVLDPEFNLHLKTTGIAELWRVRKPSTDGIVTSWEAFDADGELIVQLFGARKPGEPERDDWRELAESFKAL